MSQQTKSRTSPDRDAPANSSLLLDVDRLEIEDLRKRGSLKDWRIFILSNAVRKYNREKAEQQKRDEENYESCHDLPCKPSSRARVWNIHEQIAKILSAADGDDLKGFEVGTNDLRCSDRKDISDVSPGAIHETMHIVDSCLEDESYEEDSDLNEKVSSGVEETRKAASINARRDKESFTLNGSMNRPFTRNDDLLTEKENLRAVSEDFINGVCTQSIEPAIHGEDFSGFLDKTLELEEHYPDLRNSFENTRSELRNGIQENTDNERRNSEVNYECSVVRREADPIESFTFINALAEPEGNHTGVIKEVAFTEDLSLFIAKTIVNENLSYGMRLKELNERLSKGLREWNKNVAKLGSEVENERKEKINILDVLDKKEKRIELIMNELNTKVGSLEMLKESEKQCKRRLKGLTTQSKKKEAKLANLRKEMGKKIKESKELETVCLNLTKSCDTLVEKCHIKDENLRLLEANLNRTLDEMTIIKNRQQSQERNVDSLVNAIARMLVESSIRFACQSIELSREKDRVEELESTIQLLTREDRILSGCECHSNSMVHYDRQVRTQKNDSKSLPISISNDGMLLKAVAEGSLENASRRVLNNLHYRIKNMEEQLESTESIVSYMSVLSSKQYASKSYAKVDGVDVECGNLARLIVDECIQIAVKAVQVKSCMASIKQNPAEECVNSSKPQINLREVVPSSHSLRHENEDLKKILARTVSTLNGILKEYFDLFLEVEPNSFFQLKLEGIETMRQNFLTSNKQYISETSPPFTHISPGIGNAIVISKNNDFGDIGDSLRGPNRRLLGEIEERKKQKIVDKGKKGEGEEPSYLNTAGVNVRESGENFEAEANLEKIRRLMAKYVVDIAVSRALMQLGVGKEDVLKYYVAEENTEHSPSYAISFEKEADGEETMISVTARDDEHGRNEEEEQQQQEMMLLEDYDPLLMHEMESFNDVFFRFRTAKIMRKFSHLCNQASSCSAFSSELEIEKISFESLINSFEQGIDRMRSPSLSEDCLSFVKLIWQDSIDSMRSTRLCATGQLEQSPSNI